MTFNEGERGITLVDLWNQFTHKNKNRNIRIYLKYLKDDVVKKIIQIIHKADSQ